MSALVARVKAPDQRLKDETAAEMEDRGGPAHVMVSGTHGYHPEWEGRTVAELAEELRGETRRLLVLGDGGRLCRDGLAQLGVESELAPAQLLYQNAVGVGLAAEHGTPVSAQELAPVYLRISQAERERNARLQQEATQK